MEKKYFLVTILVSFYCSFSVWGQSNQNSLSINIDNALSQGVPFDNTRHIQTKDSILLQQKKVKAISSFGIESLYFDLRDRIISSEKDSITVPVKIHDYLDNEDCKCIIIINNQLIVSSSFLFKGVINENLIEDIAILDTSMKIGDIEYDKRINITTWIEYIPKVISLSDIITKYTDLDNELVLFLINGEPVISSNYSTFVVDEENLLEIVIDKSLLSSEKENYLYLINLLTKTKENMKYRNKKNSICRNL